MQTYESKPAALNSFILLYSGQAPLQPFFSVDTFSWAANQLALRGAFRFGSVTRSGDSFVSGDGLADSPARGRSRQTKLPITANCLYCRLILILKIVFIYLFLIR
jgi:hypothetical protein